MDEPEDIPTLEAAIRRAIPRRARAVMTAVLRRAEPPTTSDVAHADHATWRWPCGLFCTLHTRDAERHLRGCIGTFEEKPLLTNLDAMAAAVLADTRFTDNPVTVDELPHLLIEVSLLTPRRAIDDPRQMRIGTDGIVVAGERFGRPISGCLLPQVAADQGWDAAQTLSYCCMHKMGLPPDAWRRPTDLRFFTFQSIILDEAEDAA